MKMNPAAVGASLGTGSRTDSPKPSDAELCARISLDRIEHNEIMLHGNGKRRSRVRNRAFRADVFEQRVLSKFIFTTHHEQPNNGKRGTSPSREDASPSAARKLFVFGADRNGANASEKSPDGSKTASPSQGQVIPFERDNIPETSGKPPESLKKEVHGVSLSGFKALMEIVGSQLKESDSANARLTLNLQAARSNLAQEKQESRKKTKKLRAELTKLETARTKLETARKNDIESLLYMNAELTSKNVAMEGENKNLSLEKKALQQEVDQLRRERDAAVLDKKELKSNVADLNGKNTSLERELQSLKTENKMLKKEADQLRRQHGTAVHKNADLESKVTNLTEENAEQVLKLESLNTLKEEFDVLHCWHFLLLLFITAALVSPSPSVSSYTFLLRF